MASLEQFSGNVTQVVRINASSDSEESVNLTGVPPAALLAWDPFKPPKLAPITPPTTETQAPPAGPGPSPTLPGGEPLPPILPPVPTDDIKLLGIINLNGRFNALVSLPDEETARSVKRGELLSDGRRVSGITTHGIMVAKPGHSSRFVPIMRQDAAPAGQPWYQSDSGETGVVRGEVRLLERPRR